MDDHDLERLLHEAASSFRAEHSRSAPLVLTRRRSRALPAAAGLVTAALVALVALVLPAHLTNQGSPATTPAGALPTTSPSPHGVFSPPSSFDPKMAQVTSVALDGRWLAIAGGEGSAASRDRLEVRDRSDLAHVWATISTSYPLGSPTCLALDGDTLLWTDQENSDSLSSPGPPTRWSLWERDLLTGRTQRLVQGKPREAMVDELPCAVAGGGLAAWNLDGRLVVRDLVHHRLAATYREQTGTVAMTTSGLVLATYRNGASGGQGPLDVSLRSGPALARKAFLVRAPNGVHLSAGGGHLLVGSRDPSSQISDAVEVSTCELAHCSGLKLLRRDNGARAVVGADFAAWTGNYPVFARFDGGPVPDAAPGYVSFTSLAAFGDTLAYATETEDLKHSTMHLQVMTPSN